MKKQFVGKVLRAGSVDTKTYRYTAVVVNADEQRTEIRRLPLSELGTTAALNGWETVTVVR